MPHIVDAVGCMDQLKTGDMVSVVCKEVSKCCLQVDLFL